MSSNVVMNRMFSNFFPTKIATFIPWDARQSSCPWRIGHFLGFKMGLPQANKNRGRRHASNHIYIYIHIIYIYILNIYLSNLTINWYCLCIYYILFLTYVCMPSGTPLVVDVLGVDGFSCWNPNFGQFGRPFLVASPCFLRTSSSIVAENSTLLSAKSTLLLLKSCWIPMFAC